MAVAGRGSEEREEVKHGQEAALLRPQLEYSLAHWKEGRKLVLAHPTQTHVPVERDIIVEPPTLTVKYFTFPPFMALFDSYDLTG